MAISISMFNHKGGVSKTTTTFNLGWMMAEQGLRTLVVDADPQCNLSGLILDFSGPDAFDKFYMSEPDKNLKAAIAPAFENRPDPIKPVGCVPVTGNDRMFLLPGSIRMAEYEVSLSVANEMPTSLPALANQPGALHHAIEITAEEVKADVVLIDMNPSLSAINQNIFMTSDYFIMPCSPDYFSLMALRSFADVVPRWAAQHSRLSANPGLASAAYSYPSSTPKFLGTIIQNFRPRQGKAAAAFRPWIAKLQEATETELLPTLDKLNMALPAKKYGPALIGSKYTLSQIPDFNSLLPISQREQKPVYTLTQEDVQRGGAVWARTLVNINQFRDTFNQLSVRVRELVGL